MQKLHAKICRDKAQASDIASRTRSFRADHAGNAVFQIFRFSSLAYVLATAVSEQAILGSYGRKLLAVRPSVLLVLPEMHFCMNPPFSLFLSSLETFSCSAISYIIYP